jgi:hypothetical protein
LFKKLKNFTPTSVTCTACGLQRFSKYGQMYSKKLYNLSRGQGEGAARFVARETTIFLVIFTMIGLAGGCNEKIKNDDEKSYVKAGDNL